MLADSFAGFPLLFSLGLLDDKNRIAVRRIENRGGWDDQNWLFLRQDDGHIDEHARPQQFCRIGNPSLYPYVAAGGIDIRIECGDCPLNDLALWQTIRGQTDGQPGL